MPEKTTHLPLYSEMGSSCSGGSCAGCSSAGGGGGCGDKRRGRSVAVALAALIAIGTIPLWFLPRAMDTGGAKRDGSGVTGAGNLGSARVVLAPPPSAGVMPAPVHPATVHPMLGRAAVTSVAPAPSLRLADRTNAPMICRGQPMPHGPRGPCANCHLIVDCPAGSARSAAPVPLALPTITRNSLLPHAFAGACMHCHFILEQGPTPVNRENMHTLPLTETERELVRAGQQVVAPSALTRANAPVLSHGTILPHAFYGVCSNCHRVVDWGFGRNPAAAREALALAGTQLTQSDLSPHQIAYASPTDGGRISIVLMWFFGFVALGLFLVSMVYVALKAYLQSRPKQEQKQLRKTLNLKRWFTIHEWTSIGFGAAVVLHWIFSDLGSALLHVSLLLVVLLTLSGLIYRYKLPVFKSSKSMRWIHTQRFLSAVLVVTAILGHLAIIFMP